MKQGDTININDECVGIITHVEGDVFHVESETFTGTMHISDLEDDDYEF